MALTTVSRPTDQSVLADCWATGIQPRIEYDGEDLVSQHVGRDTAADDRMTLLGLPQSAGTFESSGRSSQTMTSTVCAIFVTKLSVGLCCVRSDVLGSSVREGKVNSRREMPAATSTVPRRTAMVDLCVRIRSRAFCFSFLSLFSYF